MSPAPNRNNQPASQNNQPRRLNPAQLQPPYEEPQYVEPQAVIRHSQPAPMQHYTPQEEVGVSGIENMEAADMLIPRLQIVQPTSTMEGALENLGSYYNTALAEFYDGVQAVVVGWKQNRVVFPDVYQQDNEVECSSPDAIKPYDEHVGKFVRGIEIFPDTMCAQCPLGKFGEDANGKPIRPACDLVYVYACIDANTGMPFSMSLRGSASSEAKKLNFMIRSFGFSTVIQFGTKQMKGARGVYFVPQFQLVGPAPDVILELARKNARSLSQQSGSEYAPSNGEAQGDVPQTGYPASSFEPTEEFPFGGEDHSDRPDIVFDQSHPSGEGGIPF